VSDDRFDVYVDIRPRPHRVIQLSDERTGERVAELEMVDSHGTSTIVRVSVRQALTADFGGQYLSAVRRLLEEAVRAAQAEHMTLHLATSMQGLDVLLAGAGFGRAGVLWAFKGDQHGGTGRAPGVAVSGADVGGVRAAGGGCLEGLVER
jgi:hypothetical protein